MRKRSGIASGLRILARPFTFPKALTGLFLCAEPDQAVLTMAFNQLGPNPVKATGNLSTVVGVLVTVESFEQKHPLIRAEMDGLSGFGHKWACCLWRIVPVRF